MCWRDGSLRVLSLEHRSSTKEERMKEYVATQWLPDLRAEEVKAIWKKEEAKTAKDAKTASKIASGADMFAEAIED